MSTIKTLVNDSSVLNFINSVENNTRRADAQAILAIFTEITQLPAKMWGTSIIGFGKYHYKSERSSQEGDWPLTGFSPRKQNISLYIMPGFETYTELLERLGKHKTSKGCLYINSLSDVDLNVLKQLIAQSYADMQAMHPTK